MREESWRDEYEVLRKKVDKSILTISDVSRVCGINRKRVRDDLKITGDISAVNLAKKLAAINGTVKL